MARRRQHEEHENHERWLVSYADFITLLFAFFVVMYAISSVNEGKYRTLSHSLMAAFHTPARAVTPVQVGVLARTREQTAMAIDAVPRNMALPEHMLSSEELQDGSEADGGNASAALDSIAEQIVTDLRPLIEMDLIKVRRTSLWLEVELNTSTLFPSGSVVLGTEAHEILRKLAAILAPFPNPIRVEGFTDDVPINTSLFASNWELSAARAARVVRLFAEEGLDPGRMAAVGFGEHRPVADNGTADGRRQNRRVALVVLAGQDSRYLMDVARERSEIQLPAPPPAQDIGP